MEKISAYSNIQEYSAYKAAWKAHAEEYEGNNIAAKFLLILLWLCFTLLVFFTHHGSTLDYILSLISPIGSTLILWTALSYTKGLQSCGLGLPALWCMLWPYWKRTDYFNDIYWEISSAGIKQESQLIEHFWNFSDFDQVKLSPEGILIYPKRSKSQAFWRQQIPYLPNHFYFLPKTAFRSSQDFEQTKRLLEKSAPMN